MVYWKFASCVSNSFQLTPTTSHQPPKSPHLADKESEGSVEPVNAVTAVSEASPTTQGFTVLYGLPLEIILPSPASPLIGQILFSLPTVKITSGCVRPAVM